MSEVDAELGRLVADLARPADTDLSVMQEVGPFGKRPSKSFISEIAKGQPVTLTRYDEADDKFIFRTVQNINPIVDAAKAFRSSGHDGYSESRELRHVAVLPNSEVVKLLQRGINVFRNEDWPKVAAMLDSADYAAFRTGGGRISRRANREYCTSEGFDRRRNRR